jgi:hypothetical protein
LPECSRRLLTRAGFFNPSLEGGLPLLLLFKRNCCGGITYKFCARVEMMSSVAD